MALDSLSVFFPAYNEERNIEQTVTGALDVLRGLSIKKFEVIIINDGSTDKTAAIANNLQANNNQIRVVNHPTNQGYGAALKSGFENSQFSWVAFTDADGQFDFSEITKLIDASAEADLILGYRLDRADPIDRKILTWGWNVLAWVLLGLDVKDYSCGFKLIKKAVYRQVSPLKTEEKVTQIELLVKAKKMGFRFSEVGVHHYPRRFGVATGGSIVSKVFFKSLWDLFKLWWVLR